MSPLIVTLSISKKRCLRKMDKVSITLLNVSIMLLKVSLGREFENWQIRFLIKTYLPISTSSARKSIDGLGFTFLQIYNFTYINES